MRGKKVGQVKAVNVRLEGFVNWVDHIANELIQERGDDMSSLAARFVTYMHKWAASA